MVTVSKINCKIAPSVAVSYFPEQLMDLSKALGSETAFQKCIKQLLCAIVLPSEITTLTANLLVSLRCFNEEACVSIPSVEGYVMVLQPEEPKISLSGINHFARSASEFESSEGVSLFPELRIISTITREVEPEGDGDEDPTGDTGSALSSLGAPAGGAGNFSFHTESSEGGKV